MDKSKIDISKINEKIKKESSFIDVLLPEVNKVIVGQKYMIERLLIGQLIIFLSYISDQQLLC